MPFPVGAAILGGSSLLGGVLGGKGAKKAAKAQAQSQQLAIDEQRRQYDQTRADLAPWRETGARQLGLAEAMLQPGYDYTASPGYQFRFNEGQRAIQGSAAARGSMLSGGTLKDLMKYGEGLAAADFGDSFNRRAGLAGVGQTATTATGQFGANAANNIGQAFGNIGQAKASGYAGVNNAVQGTLGNLMSIYSMGGFGGGGYPSFGSGPQGGGSMGFYGQNLYLGA